VKEFPRRGYKPPSNTIRYLDGGIENTFVGVLYVEMQDQGGYTTIHDGLLLHSVSGDLMQFEVPPGQRPALCGWTGKHARTGMCFREGITYPSEGALSCLRGRQQKKREKKKKKKKGGQGIGGALQGSAGRMAGKRGKTDWGVTATYRFIQSGGPGLGNRSG